MEEKEHIDVKLWDEYLIFAELFGIADKVREEFKKLYPDMKEVNNLVFLDKFDLFENIVIDISSACISGARSGYNRNIISSSFKGSGISHDYSGRSSSSGGGGSSSPSSGGSAGGSTGGGFR